MVFGDISGQLRKWQAEARKRREADAPARALRLVPEVVAHWTEVLNRAAPRAAPGKSPCDYAPWVKALSEAQGRVASRDVDEDRYAHWNYHNDFRRVMEDIALPAWPEARADLIEFALRFLEADVMLFRSGYAKRHLIQRLKQAPLSDAGIARIKPMLRRAVTKGAGLEEYRAWCKLAAHLVAEGHLPDLPGWLLPQARGTYLNYGMADGTLARQFWKADLSDSDMKRLVGGVFRPSRYAVVWPDFSQVVEIGGAYGSDEQRVKRNAWRMLDHVLRRVPDALDADTEKG